MELWNALPGSADSNLQLGFKTAGFTAFAAICTYGGTFLFTALNPASAALYVATAALASQVSYHILEVFKETFEAPVVKLCFTVLQLFQIPFFFYLFPSPIGFALSAADRLECLNATAHFVAIPVFFHLGIVAWNDPTVTHLAAAVGVLLPLANGLGKYAKFFRQM